jgi:hypothetical protein
VGGARETRKREGRVHVCGEGERKEGRKRNRVGWGGVGGDWKEWEGWDRR